MRSGSATATPKQKCVTHDHKPRELNLDRKAQQMVEEVRLATIEREHRSVGALLDNRTLWPLERPRSRARAQMRLEQQNRIDSRRGAAVDSAALMEKSEQVVKTMVKKGIAIASTSNFENEELIWATKSREAAYSQKRKFYEKDLHDFKESLSGEQRAAFKQQCRDALHDLASRYREDMTFMKEEMDLAGVFHPDANAHRAHCMYLLKLYKGIRADTIEDPVLRKLRAEGLAKEREKDEEERRQRELIESLENKGKVRDEKQPQSQSQPQPQIQQAAQQQKMTRVKIIEPLQEANSAKAEVADKRSKALQRSKSTKGPLSSAPPPPNAIKRAASTGALAAPSGSNKKVLQSVDRVDKANEGMASAEAVRDKDDSKDAHSLARSAGHSEGHEESEGGHPGADTKLFAKIKRGRLSAADPRSLLQEEASRLAAGEVLSVTKMRERSSLVDSETTQWMLSLLQGGQIAKTAQGREVTHALDSLSLLHHATDSDVDPLLRGSPTKPAKAHGARAQPDDPHRLVPFGEFVDMFRRYEEEALARREEEREKERRAREKAEKRQQHHKHHHDHHDHHEHHEHQQKHDSAEHDPAHPHETPHAPAGELPHSPSPAPSRSSSLSGLGPSAHKDINVVAIMQETDPQFDAYYKMMLRQKPQGARLFTGLVNKVTKVKRTAPLGRLAVTVLDSRGLVKPITSKGFFNVFAARAAGGEDDSDYSSVGSAVLTTREEVNETDDFSADGREMLHDAAFPGASPPPSAPDTGRGSPSDVSGSRTPQSRRKARSRDRRKPGVLDDAATEGAEPDFQQKLVCVWDALQMPVLNRLSFMRKYASHQYAAELSRATDMWGEVAVLCLARTGVVDRERVKVKEGYAVLPLSSANLLSYFSQTLPPILASTAPNVCVQLTATGPAQEPLSVAAIRAVRAAVEGVFPAASTLETPERNDRGKGDGTPSRAAHRALQQLEVLSAQIDGLLLAACDRVQAALNDSPSFAGTPVAEWLQPPKAEVLAVPVEEG